MKDYARIARDNFEKGYNCAQAVACAFCEEMNLEEASVAKMMSSFGGGLGKQREICGAVSGASFVLGVLRGYSNPAATTEKTDHYARIQDFCNRFKAVHETIICRELLKNLSQKKINSPEPEPRTEEYYRVRPCARFVEDAAKIVADMLAE